MNLTITIALFLIFTIADALSDSWQIRQLKNAKAKDAQLGKNLSSKWHAAQGLRQLSIIIFVSFHLHCIPSAFAAAALFWIIHDMIVNKVGLNQSLFYVGQTAKIDRLFRKTDAPELLMIVTKTIALFWGVFYTVKCFTQ